ncbi:MAG: hypothetical protein WBM54_12015 [Woeseia sp.]
MTDELPTAAATAGNRMRLLRDIATLQVKLLVDGFRDLLLVPASLVLGLLSLLGSADRSDNSFYELLRLGKRSEQWINLFGAIENDDRIDSAASGDDIDRMVQRVETFIVDEYRHGHLSSQAREKLEKSITRLRDAAKRHADS